MPRSRPNLWHNASIHTPFGEISQEGGSAADRFMKTNFRRMIKEYGIITLGTLLVTAGIYFFKYPNNFSTGGVSGISVIVNGIAPQLSRGTVVTVINLSLLVLGYLVVGKEFGVKTVYASLLMSFSIDALEHFYPMAAPFTSQPLLELIFAILLPAIGSSVLFSTGASTGGTDIVAMIIRKYFRINISRALFFSDVLIVVACAFVFGIETGLYSFLGLASKAFVVNGLIESIYTSKYMTVITDEKTAPLIEEFITDTLHRSATVSTQFHGSFTGAERAVILTVLNRSEARRLQDYVRTADPNAFNIISNTSEIIGKGFREPM